MAKNLLKPEAFEIFKSYFNKDFECSRTLFIEGNEYLLRGYKVVEVKKVEDGDDNPYFEDLSEADFKILFEDFLLNKGIDEIEH